MFRTTIIRVSVSFLQNPLSRISVLPVSDMGFSWSFDIFTRFFFGILKQNHLPVIEQENNIKQPTSFATRVIKSNDSMMSYYDVELGRVLSYYDVELGRILSYYDVELGRVLSYYDVELGRILSYYDVELGRVLSYYDVELGRVLSYYDVELGRVLWYYDVELGRVLSYYDVELGRVLSYYDVELGRVLFLQKRTYVYQDDHLISRISDAKDNKFKSVDPSLRQGQNQHW